jgi:hypothetical protein
MYVERTLEERIGIPTNFRNFLQRATCPGPDFKCGSPVCFLATTTAKAELVVPGLLEALSPLRHGLTITPNRA